MAIQPIEMLTGWLFLHCSVYQPEPEPGCRRCGYTGRIISMLLDGFLWPDTVPEPPLFERFYNFYQGWFAFGIVSGGSLQDIRVGNCVQVILYKLLSFLLSLPLTGFCTLSLVYYQISKLASIVRVKALIVHPWFETFFCYCYRLIGITWDIFLNMKQFIFL